MNYFRKVLTIFWKDALSELRTREVILTILVFAILVLVIFNFTFDIGEVSILNMTPGILWVTFTFAGVLSLNRSFAHEKNNGCFEALMLCPVSRDAIYVGKMLSNLLFMLIVEAITLPVFSFFFNIDIWSGQLILVTFLATIGFAVVGTLFSALAVNTRVRELALPVLFLPLIVPLLIGAVNATGDALAAKSWGDISSWLLMMLAYDIIFFIVSYLIFEHVIED